MESSEEFADSLRLLLGGSGLVDSSRLQDMCI